MIAIALAALIIQLVSAFHLPLWGDDYLFIEAAKHAQRLGQPWWQSLIDPIPDKFWRPLGEDITWRYIVAVADNHWLAGRITAVILFIVMIGCVYWALFGYLAVSQAAIPTNAAALLGALLYALHPAHWLQLSWTSAINGIWVLAFSALTIGSAIRSWSAEKNQRWIWLAVVLLNFLLALLCKEIAIVLPVLVGVLYLAVRDTVRADQTVLISIVAMGAMALLWLWLRHFHIESESTYSLSVGTHMARNGTLYTGFMLAAPREALRTLSTTASLIHIGLIVLPVLLQLSALLLAFKSLLSSHRWSKLLPAIVFIIIACLPYVLLEKIGYAYYTTLALFSYAFLIAIIVNTAHRVKIILLCLTASLLSTVIDLTINSNGLYSNVRKGEAYLHALEDLKKSDPAPFQRPMQVLVDSEDAFYPIGVFGLSYRLGANAYQIHIDTQCYLPGKTLVLQNQQPPHWIDCEVGGER